MLLVLRPVTQLRADREDGFTRTVKLDECASGAGQVTSPELIQHEGIEAPVARMKGEDVDARSELGQDPVRRDTAQAEMILATTGAIQLLSPLRPHIYGHRPVPPFTNPHQAVQTRRRASCHDSIAITDLDSWCIGAPRPAARTQFEEGGQPL